MPNCPRADSRTAGAEGGGGAGRARARDARQHLRVLSWQATGALWRGDRCRTWGEIGVETRVGGPARATVARVVSRANSRVSRAAFGAVARRGRRKISVKHAWEQADERACFFVGSEIVSLVFHRRSVEVEPTASAALPSRSSERRFSWRAEASGSAPMPAPPFLVGLSAGASVAAVVRAVAETRGDGAAEANARGARAKRLTVRPKPFRRVPAEQIPADPCPECDGCGKVMCTECSGRGRTNFIDQAMLPKTVWPEWCAHCRGSGRVFCARCSGQGNYRAKIGFDLGLGDD